MQDRPDHPELRAYLEHLERSVQLGRKAIQALQDLSARLAPPEPAVTPAQRVQLVLLALRASPVRPDLRGRLALRAPQARKALPDC